jgi:hypothetical protein
MRTYTYTPTKAPYVQLGSILYFRLCKHMCISPYVSDTIFFSFCMHVSCPLTYAPSGPAWLLRFGKAVHAREHESAHLYSTKKNSHPHVKQDMPEDLKIITEDLKIITEDLKIITEDLKINSCMQNMREHISTRISTRGNQKYFISRGSFTASRCRWHSRSKQHSRQRYIGCCCCWRQNCCRLPEEATQVFDVK